jgi:hypothetical protein
MYRSTSLAVKTYVDEFAFEISVYVPEEVDALFHWYEYEVGELVQVPFAAVKVNPARAVPLIVGAEETDGGKTPEIVSDFVMRS